VGGFSLCWRATALTAALLAPEARAQTPAPAPAAPKARKAAPKAAPAAPAAPAPAAQQAPRPRLRRPAVSPRTSRFKLIYAPWTKFCLKGQEANAKQVCFTGKDGRIESGQPVIAAVIIEPEGEPKKSCASRFRWACSWFTVPASSSTPTPRAGPLRDLFCQWLHVGLRGDAGTARGHEEGQNLVVQAINSNGAPLTLPLPLAEFAKAYDGPPTDPKEFEQTQKKLQEELQSARTKHARSSRPTSPGRRSGHPAAK